MVITGTLKKILRRTAYTVLASCLVSALATCDLFNVGLGAKVDISAPVLEISSPSNGAYVSGPIHLVGTVSDDIGVASVSVAVSFPAGSGLTNPPSASAAISGTAWSLDLDTTVLAPNTEVNANFLVTAADLSGKTSQRKIILYLDSKLPTVKLSSPTEDDLNAPDYLLNGSVLFRGAADSDVADLILEAGGREFRTTNGNNASFKIQVDTGIFAAGSGGVTDGGGGLLLVPWKLWAIDNAGNKSLEVAGTDGLKVIQSSDSPVVSLDAIDPAITVLPVGVLATNRFADDETVSGVITDDDAIDFSSIVVTLSPRQGGPSYSFSQADANLTLKSLARSTEDTSLTVKASFTFKVPSAAAQGAYDFTFHAADLASAKLPPLELSLPAPTAAAFDVSGVLFLVDNGAPTATISTPKAGAFLQSLSSTGVAEDGLAVQSIEYQVDSKAEGSWTAVANPPETSVFNWTFSTAALPEGGHTLYVRAIGQAGDVTTPPASVDITIDTTPPTVQILSASPAATSAAVQATAFAAVTDAGVPGGQRSFINGVTMIKGFAGDTAALKTVTWTLLRDSDAAVMASGTIPDAERASWTVDIDTTALADGSRYLFSATATDQAGGSATATRTLDVLQSDDLPSFTLQNLSKLVTTSGAAGTNLLVNNPKVDAVIWDDDWVDASSVAILLDMDPATALPSDWKSVSSASQADGSATCSYGFSVDGANGTALAEGRHRLYLRASDQDGGDGRKHGLGAVSSVLGPVWFAIDMAAPVVSFAEAGQGLFVNATKSLSGTVTDGNTVSSLEVKAPGDPDWTAIPLGAPVAGGFAWAYSVDVSAFDADTLTAGLQDGPMDLSFRAYDEFGRETIQVFSVTVDRTAPSVEFVSVSPELSGSRVNGIIVVKGTTSDVNPIAAVTYSAGGAPYTATGLSGTSSSWNFQVDTTAAAPGSFDIKVKASDRAGNETIETWNVIVDQDSDKPTFILSNASPTPASVSDLRDVDGYVVTNRFTSSAPSLIAKALDDDWVNGSSVTILVEHWNGTGWDAAPAYSGPVSSPDGSGVESAFQHNFSALADGFYRMRLSAWDTDDGASHRKLGLAAVQGSSDWAIFGYDLGAPTLSITSAPTATSGAFTVSGTVVDGNAVKKVEISVDGTNYLAATSFAAGSWSCSSALAGADGTYKVYIKATDDFRNEAIATVDIILDKTAPSATISAPLPGLFAGPTAALNGGAADNVGGSGVQGVEYALMLGTALPGAGDWHAAGGGVSWSAVVDTTGFAEGSWRLHVRARDQAGNVQASPSTVDVIVDQGAPVLSLTALASPVLSTTVAMGGSATDERDHSTAATNGVASMSYSIDDDSFASPTAIAGSFTTTTAFSFTIAAAGFNALSEGPHNVYVKAFDKAGRSSVASFSFTRDVTAPAAAFSNLSAEAVLQDAAPTATGSLSDTSGILRYAYRLEKGSWNGSAWTYATVAGNDFADTWTAAAGSPKSLPWSISLPALDADEGRYRLSIAADDVASPTNALAASSVEFFVDRHAPTLDIDAIANEFKNADFSVGGSASDASGIKTVQVKIDSRPIVSATGYETWSYPVDIATPSGSGGLADGTHTVSVVATDRSGKTTTASTSFVKDRTAPAISPVTISALLSGDLVNGSITASGSASDSGGLDRIDLAVTGTKPDGSAYSGSFPGLGPSTWVEAFDTVTAFKDGTSVSFTATAWDKAGNSTASATKTVSVNQDSNKPVIKLINLATTGTPYLKQTVINGSITDDDGTVTTLRMKTGAADSFADVTLDGQSFAYTVLAPDGSKDLYFEVTDAAGTVFTTSLAATSLSPRLYQSLGVYLETPLGFKFDTAIPTIEDTVTVDRALPFDFAADAQTLPLTTNMAFGGGSRDFQVRVEASDVNGIKSISVAVPGAGSFAATHTAGNYYVTGTIGVGSVGNGTISMTITVTDNADLIATTSRTVIIDNAAPTLTIISPANAALKNGAVQVSFSVADSGSSLSSLSYRLGRDYASMTAVGLSYPGISTLDIDGSAVDAASGYSYTSGTSTLYLYPLVVKAIDGAGNELETAPIGGTGATRSTTTSLVSASLAGNGQVAVGQAIVLGSGALPLSGGFVRLVSGWDKDSGTITLDSAVAATETTFTIVPYGLRINPDADKPSAALIYPAAGSTLGGTIRVYGSALDDDGVSEVYMQIDTDSDGSFGLGDDAIGGWYNGDNGKLVSGQSNWNQTINESLELNPSGDDPKVIKLRVRVKDINGTYGPWTDPVQISIDKNVPKLGSTYALKLDPDSDKSNGNETTYTSGMYIKGAWTLRGSVEDETAIKKITVTGEASLAASIEWNGSAYVGDTSMFEFVTSDSGGAGSALVRCKRIDLKVPVTSPDDTSVTWNFTLTALDVSEPAREASQGMKLNIDTKAPSVAYTGSTTIRQSSGTYKYQGTAADSGSGLDRVEVYLVRRGNGSTTVDRFYLPKPNTSSNTVDRLDVVALSDRKDFTNGAGVIYPANAAYLLTVDDTKTPASDSDGYDELVSEIAVNSYEWKMFINSLSVPDGPIEIHYVAYDKAGNSTHLVVPGTTAKVENNAPTVGAIWLGTDLNDDGSVDTGAGSAERSKYVFGESETSKLTAFKVRNDPMRIDFEIADTNGDSNEDGNGILEAQLFTGPDSASLTARGAFIIRNGGAGTGMTPIGLDATALAAIADGTRLFRFTIWDSTEETTRLSTSLFVTRDITCKVKLGDDRSPVTVINPLYWDDSGHNSLLGYSSANGHIEVNGVPGDTADPKVSGQISMRGTTTDDKRVSEIWMHIDNFAFPGSTYSYAGYPTPVSKSIGGGGTYYRVATYDLTSAPGAGDQRENGFIVRNTYATNGWKFTVVSSTFNQGSHVVEWRLDWNSALITGVAANNQTVSMVAEDKPSSPNQSSQTASSTTVSGTAIRDDATHIRAVALQGLPTLWEGLGVTVGATVTTVADYTSASGLIELADPVSTLSTAYSITLPPNTPSDVYDVVPYISGISRNGVNTNRSKYGVYPLKQAETGIVISGFNLGSAASLPVARVAATGSGGTAGAGTQLTVAGNLGTVGSTVNHYVSMNVTGTELVNSGYLVVTVGGVPSINNIDGHGAWNKESGIAGTEDYANWYDDRYLQVWQVNLTFNGSAGAKYPSMAIDNTGALYGAWINYGTSYLLTNTVGGAAATRFATFDPPEYTDLYIDPADNLMSLAFLANHYGGSGWNVTHNFATSGAMAVYTAAAPAVDNGRNNDRTYAIEDLYHDQQLWQFARPKIVRFNGGATASDRLHTAYFDTDTSAVKYSYSLDDGATGEKGWIVIDGGTDTHDLVTGISDSRPSNASLTDDGLVGYVGIAIGDAILVNGNARTISAFNAVSGQVTWTGGNVAGVVPYVITPTTTNPVPTGTGLARSAAAGEYVAIDVDESGYPAIAYYDIANQTLKLARASSADPNGYGNWTRQSVFPGGDANAQFAGQHVAMKFDPTGGLHIVCYRSSTGDLLYLYAPNPASAGDPYVFQSSVIIDYIGAVGAWADISLEGVIPHISYLNSSMLGTFDGLKYATKRQVRSSVTSATTTTITANRLIGNTTIAVGDTLVVYPTTTTNNADSRTITAFDPVTGTISWTTALAYTPPAARRFVVAKVNAADPASEWEHMITPSYAAVSDQRSNIEVRRGVSAWGEVAVGYLSNRFELMYLKSEP